MEEAIRNSRIGRKRYRRGVGVGGEERWSRRTRRMAPVASTLLGASLHHTTSSCPRSADPALEHLPAPLHLLRCSPPPSPYLLALLQLLLPPELPSMPGSPPAAPGEASWRGTGYP
eukprot:766955-Hanusia_phi.AAC.8